MDEERYDYEAKVMKHNNDVGFVGRPPPQMDNVCYHYRESCKGMVYNSMFYLQIPYHPRFMN